MKYTNHIINYIIAILSSTSIAKANFIDDLANTENQLRAATIKNLLTSFDKVLEDKSQGNLLRLKSIRNEHNTGYDFGDEQRNKKSLYNWLLYTRSLYALQKLGSQNARFKLREELDRTKRRLAKIDCYTDGENIKYWLSGIWSEVATFDVQERKKLLKALQQGKEIPYDKELIKFFQNYSFSYQ